MTTDPIKLDPEKTAEIDSTAQKIRDLIAKRPPPCAETRRQAATVVAAALASATASQAPQPQPKPTKPSMVRPALALLLWVGLLSGCSLDPALRAHVEESSKAWEQFRDASQPAAGVSSESWGRLKDSLDRGYAKQKEAAHAE